MSGDRQADKADTASTYVLEETAVTKATSLEELAKLAAGQEAEPEPEEASDEEPPA